MKFFLMLHQFKEFNNTFHHKSHAVSILSICNIKSLNLTLHFTHQKQQVHLLCDHEVESATVFNLSHKRCMCFELLICECRLSEPHRIVRL